MIVLSGGTVSAAVTKNESATDVGGWGRAIRRWSGSYIEWSSVLHT